MKRIPFVAVASVIVTFVATSSLLWLGVSARAQGDLPQIQAPRLSEFHLASGSQPVLVSGAMVQEFVATPDHLVFLVTAGPASSAPSQIIVTTPNGQLLKSFPLASNQVGGMSITKSGNILVLERASDKRPFFSKYRRDGSRVLSVSPEGQVGTFAASGEDIVQMLPSGDLFRLTMDADRRSISPSVRAVSNLAQLFGDN